MFTHWDMGFFAVEGEEELTPEETTDETDEVVEEEAVGDPDLYWTPGIEGYLTKDTIIFEDIASSPKIWKLGSEEHYVFNINNNESDPEANVEYVANNIWPAMTPARMNFETGTFDYGTWKHAFFIRDLRVVMLNQDGTEAYELDPNDYSKKLDGTPSDYNDPTYPGNVMIAFPKVYIAINDLGDGSADIHISNRKISERFLCYAHTDANGNELDYCYIAAYDGSVVDGIMRSISGLLPQTNITATQEMDFASANNHPGDSAIEVIASGHNWFTGVASDRLMVQLLLIMVARNTDSFAAYGHGNNNGYYANGNTDPGDTTGILASGTMDQNGLFWGTNDDISGVKVFGIENFWGNIWKRISGWVYDKNGHRVKMTVGTSDESTTIGYNTSGNGYVTIPNSAFICTSGAYISKMIFDSRGLFPIEANGSNTTFYTDALWCNNLNGMACVGGGFSSGLQTGLNTLFGLPAVGAQPYVGASLSYKGLAEPEETEEENADGLIEETEWSEES